MTRREAIEHVGALERGGVRRARAECPEGAYETMREPGETEITRLFPGWGGKSFDAGDPELASECQLEPGDAQDWHPGPLPVIGGDGPGSV